MAGSAPPCALTAPSTPGATTATASSPTAASWISACPTRC